MLKPILAASLILGSASLATAMPVAGVQTGSTLPVVKAAVVVKKTVVRRAPMRPMRRTVVKKTVIRR